jgi:hypothetical protein
MILVASEVVGNGSQLAALGPYFPLIGGSPSTP